MADKETAASEWGRVADDYNQFATNFTSLHAFDLLRSLSDQILSATTVLEVAGGTGALCTAYIKMFPKGIPGQTFIMTDISPEMVSIAEREIRSRLPPGYQTEMQFRTEDGIDMKSVEDSSIDVLVSCFGVFLIPEQDAMFSEVKRVLKPGGIFGATAWTDCPSGADFKTHGFGIVFEATVEAAFSKLNQSSTEDSSAKPMEAKPPWKAWSDPDLLHKIICEASFAKVKVHRTIHTTTFQNMQTLWYAITRTCPFVDISKVEPGQLEEVRKTFWDAVGVESEDDIVYAIMASNVAIAVL